MTTFACDIAVIGGGCIGSSIVYELSRRGLGKIVLVDQGRHTSSATANSGGIVRVFHEQPEHIQLALASHLRYTQLHQSGVLRETARPQGSLYFFRAAREREYQAGFSLMSDVGYPFEILSGTLGQKRFPDFHWDDDDRAVYEPLGSQLSPRRFVDDLLAASDVQILDSFEVRKLSRDGNRFRVDSDGITVIAKSLILAGGARLLPRFADLGLRLPLEAKTLTTYLAQKHAGASEMPNFFDRETLEYGAFGSEQALLSHPHLARVFRRWGPVVTTRVADDCYAPNRLGILSSGGEESGLWVATGWGGTGFKFALAIGQRLVERYVERIPSHAAR